jgi:hypothetical protein
MNGVNMTDMEIVKQTYPAAVHSARRRRTSKKGEDGFKHTESVVEHAIYAGPYRTSSLVSGKVGSELLAWKSARRGIERRAAKAEANGAAASREVVLRPEDQGERNSA